MADSSINDCCPELQIIIPSFTQKCFLVGINTKITITWRGAADQNAAAAAGASKATAGHSPHNFVDLQGRPCALAFDFVILRNGQPVWDGGDPDYARAGAIGKGLGLAWGGDWTLKHDGCEPDYDHLQLPNWRHYQPLHIEDAPNA